MTIPRIISSCLECSARPFLSKLVFILKIANVFESFIVNGIKIVLVSLIIIINCFQTNDIHKIKFISLRLI